MPSCLVVFPLLQSGLHLGLTLGLAFGLGHKREARCSLVQSFPDIIARALSSGRNHIAFLSGSCTSLLYNLVFPTVFDGMFRQNGEPTVADMSDCAATVNLNHSGLHREGFCHRILARPGT